jgi:hypothetical protein
VLVFGDSFAITGAFVLLLFLAVHGGSKFLNFDFVIRTKFRFRLRCFYAFWDSIAAVSPESLR